MGAPNAEAAAEMIAGELGELCALFCCCFAGGFDLRIQDREGDIRMKSVQSAFQIDWSMDEAWLTGKDCF